MIATQVHARVLLRICLYSETNTPLVGTSQNKDQKTAMLVDVYRPQRFIDLVGDDRVHREVLAWVKEWDFCVFGNKKGKKRQRDEENLDPYRRPQEKVSLSFLDTSQQNNLSLVDIERASKILLISGPRARQTTLATVVANHAGYKVFDVNARSVAPSNLTSWYIFGELDVVLSVTRAQPRQWKTE